MLDRLSEVSLPLVVRFWDTYFSEDKGFSNFHVYVCSALLVSFSEELKAMTLEEMIVFLQALPTRGWDQAKAESILSQAFILQSLFDASPAHLKTW